MFEHVNRIDRLGRRNLVKMMRKVDREFYDEAVNRKYKKQSNREDLSMQFESLKASISF